MRASQVRREVVDVPTKRAIPHLLRFGGPWLLVFVSLIGGVLIHLLVKYLMPGDVSQALAAVLLTLATCVITAVTRMATGHHGPVGSYPHVLLAAYTGLTLILYTVFGFGVYSLVWLGLGMVLSICHNIIVGFHRGVGDTHSPQAALGAMLGLPGSRLSLKTSDDGAHAKGSWDLARGDQTADDAQARRGSIASAAGVGLSDVTILPGNGGRDHGRADVRVDLVNKLENPTLWPGPQHAGTDPTVPVPIGLYRDGTLAKVTLLTADDGAIHQLDAGMTGSGKTNAARITHMELMTRRFTSLIAVDAFKPQQGLACLRPGLDAFITDEATARRLFAALPDYITERSNYLGQRKLDNWAPGCGINFVKFHIEEAHQYTDAKSIATTAVAARSVGCQLNLSLQRAVYTQIDTTVRAQLGTALCFGLSDQDDPALALGDQAVAAGADPTRWANREPGMAHLIGSGIDPAHLYMPLRAWKVDRPMCEAHAREWAPRRDPLDEMTAEWLRSLRIGVTVIPVSSARSTTVAPVASVPAPAPVRSEPDEEIGYCPECGATDGDEHRAACPDYIPGPTTADPAPELDVDLDAELPDVPDIPLGVPAPTSAGAPLDAAAAREVLIEAIRQLVHSQLDQGGTTEFTPASLHHVTATVGRTRTWIYEACRALARDGLLRGTDAGYELPQRELVPAARMVGV
jgi:hypothetical protein